MKIVIHFHENQFQQYYWQRVGIRAIVKDICYHFGQTAIEIQYMIVMVVMVDIHTTPSIMTQILNVEKCPISGLFRVCEAQDSN